jgi:hypothetical protein
MTACIAPPVRGDTMRILSGGFMHKVIYRFLLIVGIALFAASMAGLYNSVLDSRVAFVIALGFAGMALFGIGLRAAPAGATHRI